MKLVSKGYTLHVTSWENDGDHYATIQYTTESEAEACVIKHLCRNLFSCSNGRRSIGVGNLCDCDRGLYKERVMAYLRDYPEALPAIREDTPENYLDDEDFCMDSIQGLAYELMGASEYYEFRVCEKVVITYYPEDIIVEELSDVSTGL